MESIVCDYLKIGDKTYAVKEVNMPNVDINEELRQAYEAKYQELKAKYGEGVAETVMNEWNTQIDHLQSVKGRTDVKVPAEFVNNKSIVTIRSNQICECRLIRYAPTEVMTSWDYLPEDVQNALASKKELFEALGSLSDSVYIKIKEGIVLPLIISYAKKEERLYAENMLYFHSYPSGGRLCTDRNTAQEFWNAEDFEGTVNRINWFSPANRYVKYQGLSYNLINYLNLDTFLSVERVEDVQWRT